MEPTQNCLGRPVYGVKLQLEGKELRQDTRRREREAKRRRRSNNAFVVPSFGVLLMMLFSTLYLGVLLTTLFA